MRTRFQAIAGLAVWATTLFTVHATTLERLTVNDMTDKSTAIVRATASLVGGELQSGVIYTHYQLTVTEVWKGSASRTVDVWVPGGVANGIRQLVPGAPSFDAGTDYVVFLWTGKSGRTQVIGLSQGLFRVATDTSGNRMAERPGVSEMMIDPRTGRPVTDETVRIRVSDLKAQVLGRLSAAQ